jgi:hypothetical protein
MLKPKTDTLPWYINTKSVFITTCNVKA